MSIGPITRSSNTTEGSPVRPAPSAGTRVDAAKPVNAVEPVELTSAVVGVRGRQSQAQLDLIQTRPYGRPEAGVRAHRRAGNATAQIGAIVDDGISDLLDQVATRVDHVLQSASIAPHIKSALGDSLVVFEGLMRRAQSGFLGGDTRSVEDLARRMQNALDELLANTPHDPDADPDSAATLRMSRFAADVSALFQAAVARMTEQLLGSMPPPPADAGISGRAYDRYIARSPIPPAEDYTPLDVSM